MNKIELLAPAGDMERLQMAAAYGADAVYLAGTLFGMRSFAGNFSPEELKTAVEFCHRRGVRVHVTCNTMPRNEEVARLPDWLSYLDGLGVDAVILADVGVLSLAAKHAPHVPRHISTQASIVNYQSARAWYELGAQRVILARELTLEEIREIRAKTPKELEMEVFAHGAMCVSYSGRCLLSNYMTGRDSNRGACAQPCRYQYALMEEKRPGEYFPVYEENGETYIMNSRDMCMIDHVAELMEAGVDSIKLEGRAKSAYYAARVGRGGAYQPPALLHRLFLWPAGAVHRRCPVCPGLADRGEGPVLRRGGERRPDFEQQVCRGGRPGAGGPRCPPPGSDGGRPLGRGRTPPGGGPPPPDGVPYEAAPAGAAPFAAASEGGPVTLIMKRDGYVQKL